MKDSENNSLQSTGRLKRLWDYFTPYERCWYICVLILAGIFAVLFPEEDVNGVHGELIMALYLADTFLNVTCELLISKQSKWNFIVSVFIELTEICIFVLLSYRFATMLTTLFFWLPIDIISFLSWRKHPDEQKKELTQVRSLTGWQHVAVVAGIVVWTVVIGTIMCYVTENITVTTLFEGRRDVEIIVCYLDAMISALDIANGTFILLRYREQWIAWYLEVILDAAALILAGQYALLVLTAAYLTNTTYGYIKWSRYAKEHKGAQGTQGDGSSVHSK